MQENIVYDETTELNNSQILITGIYWSKDVIGKYRSKKDADEKLVDQISIDLPQGILDKKDMPEFYDIVETFVYNFLAKRFNHIANRCQIWLPLENEEKNV